MAQDTGLAVTVPTATMHKKYGIPNPIHFFQKATASPNARSAPPSPIGVMTEQLDADMTDPVPDCEAEIRTCVGGQMIVASDYKMRWNPETKMTQHTSTHEITADPDGCHMWVSGMSCGQLARVKCADPTKQDIFRFDLEGVACPRPHTVRFDKEGRLWVGLEFSGLICQMDARELCRKPELPGSDGCLYRSIGYDDFKQKFGVNLQAFPRPIATHPHGFCFDEDKHTDGPTAHIWFTGKLTNTVGRLRLSDGAVEHFELPTLGAVPIYVELGCDRNIWGTCLDSNKIFRVTQGESPLVTEVPITRDPAGGRRPIAIKRSPCGEAMWFSNEAGHSVARVDTAMVERIVSRQGTQPTGDAAVAIHSEAVASLAAEQGVFEGPDKLHDAVLEYAVPMMSAEMKLAGLAFDKEGNLWTQSYHGNMKLAAYSMVDKEAADPDYIVKIDSLILQQACDQVARRMEGTTRDKAGKMSGIPVQQFELPTTATTLHRIVAGPPCEQSDSETSMWFTELFADRVGTVRLCREA